MVTKNELKNQLINMGIEPGMILEAHSSLSSFGEREGGAITVIDTLKEFKELGITVKIKVLDRDEKKTAMHYMENDTPDDIRRISAPSTIINEKYPPDKWFMEAGHPPVKAWYKIQDEAYSRGLIKETYIGPCKVMFFDIYDVVSIYRDELLRAPYELWGIEK